MQAFWGCIRDCGSQTASTAFGWALMAKMPTGAIRAFVGLKPGAQDLAYSFTPCIGFSFILILNLAADSTARPAIAHFALLFGNH